MDIRRAWISGCSECATSMSPYIFAEFAERMYKGGGDDDEDGFERIRS